MITTALLLGTVGWLLMLLTSVITLFDDTKGKEFEKGASCMWVPVTLGVVALHLWSLIKVNL